MSICCGSFILLSQELLMETHRVVSHDEWIAARKAYLAEEKTFTRARDA